MNIEQLRTQLRRGLVIPACPLALDDQRRWSERHQRALVRYYLDSGAGGLAVGVHATQFAIRDPKFQLFEPVLQACRHESRSWLDSSTRSIVHIAGICGKESQALREAEFAMSAGYDAGLVSMSALGDLPEPAVVAHCRRIAEVIPIIGFYLQPAVGGRVFTYNFWQRICEIENLVAIKIAPFNRYQTWDVVRAVLESDRRDVALYTGNDDNIVIDLLTPFSLRLAEKNRRRFIDGGLLGQWGVWTQRAVEMLAAIQVAREQDSIDQQWLEEQVALTDANAAIFDSANGFAGCIPGVLEVLRRQGLVSSHYTLDPAERLSPGQAEQLDRVCRLYPQLTDDEFVRQNQDRWLS